MSGHSSLSCWPASPALSPAPPGHCASLAVFGLPALAHTQVTESPLVLPAGWILVIAALALVLLAGLAARYRLQVQSLERQARDLERQVAERTADNVQLVEDTRRQVAQLTALQETTRAVASTLDLDSLLSLIIQQATSLLAGEGGLLNLVHWDHGEDEVVAGYGSMAFAAGVRAPLDESLSGWVTLNHQAVISNDLANDPRVHRTAKEWVDHRQVHNAALAPLVVSDRVIGTLVVINKRNGQSGFDQNDLDLLQPFADQAAMAIRNAQMFAAEQRRADQFRVISEVSSKITTIMPVEEILTRVARLVYDTFDYYHVGIGLVEGDEVVYRVGAGELWESLEFQFKPARLKIGRSGLSGWVAATGQAVMAPDVRLDARYVELEGSEALSEIVVPISVKGQVIGVLDVQSRQRAAFDETDLNVLQALAHQTGAAIENTHLYQQAQQAAVLEERGRLARDLHDAVTQTLFSASLLAEVLPATWEMDQERGRELLKELRQLSRGALAEMRTLLLELRPSVLAEADLADLLRQLAEAVAGRTGVAVQVDVDQSCELSEDVRIALYRIAQEALNNVVKHARARHVAIGLSCPAYEIDGAVRAREAQLVIADDGVGFDTADLPHDRLGLNIIRERAETIGAQLTVTSVRGQGTKLTVLWRAMPHDEPRINEHARD